VQKDSPLSKTRPYWTTSKFKRLVAKWNIKLDAEGLGEIGRDHVKGFISSDEREEYYRLMSHHVYNQPFEDGVHRLIMTRYVSGIMLKDICKELGEKGSPRDRRTLYRVIKKYEKLWGVRR
jgi:hypothetical protein